MKSIFDSYSYLICSIRESITCVFLSLQSSLLYLLLSTFIVRQHGHTSLSPSYLTLSLISTSHTLLDDWPMLGLLDSSSGYPEYAISADDKGFDLTLSFVPLLFLSLKGWIWTLVCFYSFTLPS